MINNDSKVYVAGHRGMVGSALIRTLSNQGYTNLVTRTHQELDLTQQNKVNQFISDEKPDVVILAAAKVGGIYANSTYPADFIYDNLIIAANVIHAAHLNNVKKLIFLGSSCIYPKFANQPISESELLTSSLEPTNEAYAIAKISGLKLCEFYNQQYGHDFSSVMPTNLYGLGDNYDLENSHVLPALIKKIHDAKINNYDTVTIWGTGRARREFLFSDDLAEAIVFLLQNRGSNNYIPLINIGSGVDLTIAELAQTIAKVIGYQGEFVYDHSKPDGTPRKLLDISKISEMGWTPKFTLPDGIKLAYSDFCQNYSLG